MLAIGYPIYWSEMLSGSARNGVTSPIAFILFSFFAAFILWRERHSIVTGCREYGQWFLSLDAVMRGWTGVLLCLIAGILMISLYAAVFPVHLLQESDALNYHYSLTRQHLIIGSFAHIPWSAFDLFLLPVDYALAPFWFVTEHPNKIPQMVCLLGLLGVLLNLLRNVKEGVSAASILALAFFVGSHGHGIQFGTAMLDLVNSYLFFAMTDSLIRRVHWLFIIEANFYLWSKPFVPVQSAVVIIAVCVVILVLKKIGFKEIYLDFQKRLDPKFFHETGIFLKRCLFGLIITAAMIGGPFVAKSMYYTGTPLYPFFPGLIKYHQIPEDSVAWTSLAAASNYWLQFTRNTYGFGRSFIDLINHFWLIAVPTHGVNNEFDYPLGLSYLLVLGPFVVFLWKSLLERRIPLLPWLVIILWASWFAGSQQSRWLYVPLLLMYITVSVEILKPSRILLGGLMVALMLNLVSLGRAYAPDFKRARQDVLREQDKALQEINNRYLSRNESGYVLLEDPEVSYARFPVMIRKESLPNVVAF